MRSTIAIPLIAALAAFGCSNLERSRSLANPDISAQTIALQVCSNCHGVDGNATSPNFPNLAGQQKAYLVAQLKQFHDHSRSDPAGFEYMWGLSRSLTDAQIEGLAEYYAAQAPKMPAEPDATLAAEGREIYDKGLPAQEVPPCAACHGEQGRGNEAFPGLAYQHADYIRKQLLVFQRTDERPEGSVMKTVVHGLTERDMAAVAEFVQGFPAH
ncbi:MAG: cytochrome c4 [Candidatus Accumulibacter sp.]|uniref:c-type cytochrome n=1 Tax=Accumulibacter sp. TaxID=2053492 RepID=UPI002583BADF|nr:c-type cytochrome [Accumulibacter sp.]MCM8621970.1 cytochrome c4 [Accumulibacter sp.]